MQSTASTISARSRVEAMDCSLALISQGIESTIERGENNVGWFVLVAPEDYELALETIRLYRLENRGWGLRREVFQPGLLFDWLSVGWVALVCTLFWINATRVDLETPGVLDTLAVSHGQWWRLFTAVWLHADVAHLASNATFGVVLLGLSMGRYGAGVALVSAYLAGVGGNLLSWLAASQPHLGLGASGMVMGCLGLLAIQSISIWSKTLRLGKDFLVGLFGGVMLFVLVGVAPGTDVVAHFGGFVAGLVLGSVLSPFLRELRKPFPNALCAVCFAALVVWPWWLAFRHSRG
jgi:rhomboid protease GluP